MFSCEFCEISKNTFFTEHLQMTASEYIVISPNFLKWKLCLSTKFPHQEIRWNCRIFCSDFFPMFAYESPKNIRKLLVWWCFQVDQKGTLFMVSTDFVVLIVKLNFLYNLGGTKQSLTHQGRLSFYCKIWLGIQNIMWRFG